MKSLPQQNNISNPNNNAFSLDKRFPTCYPLSPNEASLRGFRTLLLHRRHLSTIVNNQYPSQETRDTSYRNSRTYDALKKRFRSIYMWPAFLATFLPKYVPTSTPLHILQNTPLNPNHSLLASTANRKRRAPCVAVQSTADDIDKAVVYTSPPKKARISPVKDPAIEEKIKRYMEGRTTSSHKIVS